MSDIENQNSANEKSSDLPWPVIYAVVLGAFVLTVIVLTWFTFHFTRTA